MKSIRVATLNEHKLEELRSLLAPWEIGVLGVDDISGFRPKENGVTFRSNALKKARALQRLSREPCLADDSGLEVDALGGRPGVWSADYAGAVGAERDLSNLRRLLRELEATPDGYRQARYVCVLAFVQPGSPPLFFEGQLTGSITRVARGEGGFGYDPIFWLPDRGQTVAELSSAQKHALSHRGKALRAFIRWLAEHR